MPEIRGYNIKEVWDKKLSTAEPLIVRENGTWKCCVYDKGVSSVPLETHDTGLPHVTGDEYDCEKLKVCFEWFKSVRDKYADEKIEEMKPFLATIRQAEGELHEMNAVDRKPKPDDADRRNQLGAVLTEAKAKLRQVKGV